MGEATYKAPAIDALLTSITGKNRQGVVKFKRCMTCDGMANEFTDELSKLEYKISGMCQTCQDKFFNGGE